MRTRRGAVVAGSLLAAVVLGATAGAQEYVRSAHPEFPKVIYADTLISLNDRCIVAKEKLNRRVRPVYVNGSPIGFC